MKSKKETPQSHICTSVATSKINPPLLYLPQCGKIPNMCHLYNWLMAKIACWRCDFLAYWKASPQRKCCCFLYWCLWKKFGEKGNTQMESPAFWSVIIQLHTSDKNWLLSGTLNRNTIWVFFLKKISVGNLIAFLFPCQEQTNLTTFSV